MKTVGVVLAFVVSAIAVVSGEVDLKTVQFGVWKDYHQKTYENTAEERTRMAIYESNYKFVQEHNKQADAGLHTYHVGMNEFADLTNEEFRFLYTAPIRGKRTGSTYLPAANIDLPASVDWREKGFVTDVKNQGQCGSCWAFSAVGSLEGQHFKSKKELVSLSEQNLVDCAGGEFQNQGCNGGLMDNAFDYIKSVGGLDTEKSYPYKGHQAKCDFKKENIGASVTGHEDVKQGSEDDLQKAVASVGPISVAIDASHMSFQMYHSGVYSEHRCSSEQLDHGVLVVGYGSQKAKEDDKASADYWIVKNSWGPGWGEKGYIRMSRNVDNQCGIASSASYPLV